MNHSCIYYMSYLHLPIEKHSDRCIGWRWLESYVFQTSRITAMCPTTSVGWWQKIPINCCKNSAINNISLCIILLHQQHSLWCLRDGMKVTLGGKWLWPPDRICGAFPWSQVKWQMPTTTRRSNGCFILVLAGATSSGFEEAYFRHKSGCFCPFWSCADHLSVGPAAHWDPGSEDLGWEGLEWNLEQKSAFKTAVKFLTLQRILIQDPHPEITWHHIMQNLHHLTTCRPLLQVSCEQVPLSADLTVKLLILQSEMLSLYVWWRSIALFDLLLWHATLQSNNGSVLKPRSLRGLGEFWRYLFRTARICIYIYT